MPIYSLKPAFCHFCRSPPLPHPRSITFSFLPCLLLPFAAAPCWSRAYLAIRTDLTQLLKLFKPMIGELVRSSRLKFCRLLSVIGAASATVD